MADRLDDTAFRALVARGEPVDTRVLRAVVHVWNPIANAPALARVFAAVEDAEIESVSNGTLAVLAPLATLPALRRIHMTITMAKVGLSEWLAAAVTHPRLAIEFVVELRSRRASGRTVLRIADGGRALEVDNRDSTLGVQDALREVAPGKLDAVRIAAAPPLVDRWAIQKEARRIGAALAMPPVAREPSSG